MIPSFSQLVAGSLGLLLLPSMAIAIQPVSGNAKGALTATKEPRQGKGGRGSQGGGAPRPAPSPAPAPPRPAPAPAPMPAPRPAPSGPVISPPSGGRGSVERPAPSFPSPSFPSPSNPGASPVPRNSFPESGRPEPRYEPIPRGGDRPTYDSPRPSTPSFPDETDTGRSRSPIPNSPIPNAPTPSTPRYAPPSDVPSSGNRPPAPYESDSPDAGAPSEIPSGSAERPGYPSPSRWTTRYSDTRRAPAPKAPAPPRETTNPTPRSGRTVADVPRSSTPATPAPTAANPPRSRTTPVATPAPTSGGRPVLTRTRYRDARTPMLPNLTDTPRSATPNAPRATPPKRTGGLTPLQPRSGSDAAPRADRRSSTVSREGAIARADRTPLAIATDKVIRNLPAARSTGAVAGTVAFNNFGCGPAFGSSFGASTCLSTGFSWYNYVNYGFGCGSGLYNYWGWHSAFSLQIGFGSCWSSSWLSFSWGSPYWWYYPAAYCAPVYGWSRPWYPAPWYYYAAPYPYYSFSYPVYVPTYVYAEQPVERVVERIVYVDDDAQVAPAAPIQQRSEGARIPAENESPRPIAPDAGAQLADRYITLGDMYFRVGRYDRALDSYERAGVFASRDANLQLILSDAFFAMGRYGEAARAIRAAIAIEPTLVESRADKRGFYGVIGDFERHIDALEAWVQRNPQDGDAWLVLGVNRLFREELASARDAFRQAATLARPEDRTAADLFLAAAEVRLAESLAAPASSRATSSPKR